MNDFFINLKNKYSYDDNFIDVLKRIVPVLINYYENEELVLNKLENVIIHVKNDYENPNDFLCDFFEINEKFVEYENALGYSSSRPIMDGDKICSKSIIYLFKKVSFEDINSVSILVHELCHFIKTSDFILENDRFYKNTGFQKEIYDLNGKLLERNFTALEETINSFDEENIMCVLFGYKNNYYLNYSCYSLAVSFFNELIVDIEKIFPDFKNLLIKNGLKYLSSIFDFYGVCFLNCIFEDCVYILTLQKDDEKQEKIRQLYSMKYFVLKSLNLRNNIYNINNSKKVVR